MSITQQAAPPAVAPSPDLFFETAFMHQRTWALKAAVDLDVFTAIGGGAATAAAIAERCAASLRGIRILCDYLTMAGFLTKAGERYALTQESAAFLTKSSPAYLGATLDFFCSPRLLGNFSVLADTVRRGSVSAEGNTVSEANPIWVEFARAMAPMMIMPAQAIADVLAVDGAGPLRVLDIAAGHGMFGVTIAQRNPAAEIVAVDWAPVLDVASENAAKAGVAARHTRLPGDAFTVEYGTGYDVALLTNFLHHFDHATNVTLLRKVAASLKSGGRVTILEMVPNEDRITPPMAAGFALTMLAGTPAGDAFTLADLQRMLSEVGFGPASAHPTLGPETIVVASV